VVRRQGVKICFRNPFESRTGPILPQLLQVGLKFSVVGLRNRARILEWKWLAHHQCAAIGVFTPTPNRNLAFISIAALLHLLIEGYSDLCEAEQRVNRVLKPHLVS
jgi:hypothetical protein